MEPMETALMGSNESNNSADYNIKQSQEKSITSEFQSFTLSSTVLLEDQMDRIVN